MIIHTEEMLRPAYKDKLSLASEGTRRSAAELSTIWLSWKNNRFEEILRQNQVSTGAVFEVMELRYLDHLKSKTR
jgi:hypothetical protein